MLNQMVGRIQSKPGVKLEMVEMDQNGDPVDDMPVEQPLLAVSDDSGEVDECDDFFGVHEILPKIGDEFQVKIPPLNFKPNYSANNADYQHNFLIGLPVPLKRISFNGEKREINTDSSNDLWCLVPGIPSRDWTDDEKASFVLGLYIFQKNFVEIRRFIGSKKMGAILSFYYAEFYGSDVYNKWSEGRKKKSKKCAYGARIFSGMRRQELLSRVLPTVSEDLRGFLLEDSKRFGDDKMSLSDYISSLKTTVGLKTLVEAIGIGTGKQDLTRMTFEPSSRPKQARLEVPTSKACSDLTPSEIIKFLSGDYRLSKARSNDLFWEAVWPRLLARGWHSEQPHLKNCLVFLTPNVIKFSRRKLVKGIQYFDSTSDVLNKIAKEPELIELESDQNGDETKREESLEQDDDDDDDDSFSKGRHCYLQPRTPIRSFDRIVKVFTIVDTSLPNGKIRELRDLPIEISVRLTSKDHFDDASDKKSDESETSKSGGKTKSGGKMDPGRKERDLNYTVKNMSVNSLKNQDLREKKKAGKVSRPVVSKRAKRGKVECIAPIPKRCKRLTACSSESYAGPKPDNHISSCCSSIEPNPFSQTGTYPEPEKSSKGGSPSESVECAQEPTLGIKTRILIDLNVPQFFPELENGESNTDFFSKEQEENIKIETEAKLPNTSSIEMKPEEQANVNSRRHSTRNRPPTVKALEALADGYLTVNKKKKNKDVEVAARPHSVVGPTKPFQNMVASKNEETGNGEIHSSDQSLFSKFEILEEENEESVSGQG